MPKTQWERAVEAACKAIDDVWAEVPADAMAHALRAMLPILFEPRDKRYRWWPKVLDYHRRALEEEADDRF